VPIVDSAAGAGGLPDLALIRACEERIVNCWPAVDTMLIDGFVVRFAHGYSGRANSATPIEIGADLSDEALAIIEGLYREAGLPSVVRVTALAKPGLRGAAPCERLSPSDASLGRSRISWGTPSEVAPGITIESHPEPAWLQGVSRLQDVSKRNPAHLQAIVGRIRVQAGFATVFEGGEAIGYAMCAIDRGMAEIGSVIIEPAKRGRGVGHRLIGALMRFAGNAGAHSAFLQVEAGNATAIRLYRSFGFRDVYAYRTLIRDLQRRARWRRQQSAGRQEAAAHPASACPARIRARVEMTGAA